MALKMEGVIFGMFDGVPMVPHAEIEVPQLGDECSSPAVAGGAKAFGFQVVVLNSADLFGDATQ